jgi:hypothetical protein
MNLTQIQGQWGGVFSNGTLLTICMLKIMPTALLSEPCKSGCVSKSGQLNSLMTCFIVDICGISLL